MPGVRRAPGDPIAMQRVRTRLARSGHSETTAACPLLGVKRSSQASPAVRPFRKEKRLINATSPNSGQISSASETPLSQRLGRRLLRYGIVLFLLGLATGRLVQLLPLPRMGLSSHLQGVMNGTFLVVLGLIWPHLRLHALLLGERLRRELQRPPSR